MSIWGKLLGGAAGFALGGPIGAILGAMAGNALPAFDLFKQSRSISRLEFAARMLTGLRGDQLTSLQNPLTDTELSVLISYYRNEVNELSK